MSSFERLRAIGDNPNFIAAVEGCFNRVGNGGIYAQELRALATHTQLSYGVKVEIINSVLLLSTLHSRAAKPACISIAENREQHMSPSASWMRAGARYIVQGFEQDANDTGLDTFSPIPAYRIETQGRLLLC